MVNCPVCGHPGTGDNVNNRADYIGFECPRCGPFLMTDTLLADAAPLPLNDHNLSAWIRGEMEFNRPSPEFTTDRLQEVQSNLPHYRPAEQLTLLLRAVEKKTKFPGDRVRLIWDVDYPLAWASNSHELKYLIDALCDRGMLSLASQAIAQESLLVITPMGWDYLDSIQSVVTLEEQAFVAMSFSDVMDDAWERGIKLGVEEAGYSALRVDKVEHSDKIDAKIIADIRSSRFLVVDVTEQRQGVYFEAGYALGLDRPVIWTVREDDLENVHFDTRQYNHIVWNDPDYLREQLTNRIKAIIG